MTALYSALLIGIPVVIAGTAVAIGVEGVRNYLRELHDPVDKERA
jgi:hypothetical protein